MTIDIQKLEELAKAATPGPWRYDWGNWDVECANKNYYRYSICGLDISDRAICFGSEEGEEKKKLSDHAYGRTTSDGEYIAAANPDVILRLLEVIKRQERSLRNIIEADPRPDLSHQKYVDAIIFIKEQAEKALNEGERILNG